jgi:ATP-dependent RNA helicase DHX8/PRP22
MITVAAMLSAEHVFAGGHGPDVGNGLAPDGSRGGGGRGGGGGGKREELARLMAECQGDHILLLRLYQLWAAGGCTRDFCKTYGLDLRGMNFARDVRRQLEGARGRGRGRRLGAASRRVPSQRGCLGFPTSRALA